MNKIITFATLLLFASPNNLLAQTCGSQPSAAFIEQVKQLALHEDTTSVQMASRSAVTLGVKFWDVHAPNFTSQFNDGYANSFLGVLDGYFTNIGVAFTKCGDVTSVEDNFLASFNYSDSFLDQYINTNYNIPSAINIYVVDDICAIYAGVTECGILGIGEFPWSPRIAKNTIFLKRSELLGGYGDILLIHEMGHFFGLFHTFGNVPVDDCNIISDENPDGSNCQTTGDLICDTPADPGLRCPNAYVNDVCQFVGSNGFEIYHPLTNNFMSYPPGGSNSQFGEKRYCIGGANAFTFGQLNRMATYVADRQNLVCQSGGGSGNCSDAYEPNDNRTTANTYFGTLGGTPFTTEIQAKIGVSGDADFFKVQFTQMGYLTLDIPVLSKNYNLYIYKGFQQIGYSPNSGTQPEHINFNVTISDLNTDYYFVIQGATSQDFDCDNTYRFVVNWQPGGGGVPGGGHTGGNCTIYEDITYEPNSTLFTAHFPPQWDFDPNGFDGGDIWANITSSTDVDYYKFKINSFGTLKPTYSDNDGTPDQDLKCEILNSNGVLLHTLPSDSYIYSISNFTPGNYYIRLYRPDGTYDCDLQYRVAMEFYPDPNGGGGSGGGNNNPCNPLPDANAEPNEDFANAFYNPQLQNITQGGTDITMSSYISSATDVDVYRLELNLDGMLRFEYCAPQNLNATFEVFNSSGNKINNVSIGNCTDWSMLLYNAGTYYVKIKAQNGAFNCSEPYTFRFTFTASPSGGGGNGGGGLDCSGAIELFRNIQTNCQNAWAGGCPLYTFGSTSNKPNLKSDYNCAPFGAFEGGEKLYKIEVINEWCNLGLNLLISDYGGNSDDISIHVFNDCQLTNCINSSFYEVNPFDGSIRCEFDVPDGTYYAVVDVTNGAATDFAIYAYGKFGSLDPNQPCVVISNTTDPPIITIDYSNQNTDCTCGNIPISNVQVGNYNCNSGALLTAELTCLTDFELHWFSSETATIPSSIGMSFLANQPGIYYVQPVQISTGCTGEKVPILVSPPSIPVTLLTTDVTCGMINGTIQIEVPQPGSTSDYQYLWSNGQTGSNIQGVATGTYTITITNTDGCSVVRSAFVGGSNIKVQLFKQEDNCLANPNQLIQAFANSHNPIVDYQWNTGDTTTSITSTAFGIYSITVTDSEGCTASASVQVENKSFSTLPYITQPSCKGMSNGSLALSTFHGVPPIQYQWSNGAAVSEVFNLSKGDYVCTVTDARGCEIIDTIQVTEPDSMIFHVLKTNPTCWDSLNGKIAVFVQGGTRFYEYTWDNGMIDNKLNQLDGGDYVMTVTDWNGCIANVIVSLPKPDSLSVLTNVSDVPCAGLATGAINLQASGGTMPYNYQWQSGDTIASLTNLLGGIYQATVIDANGCQKTLNASVSQPNALTLQTATTDVSCFGGNNGGITVQTNGGTAPFNIAFDNGNGTNLTAGQYIVLVTDANDCPVTDTVIITEPAQLIGSMSKSDVSCAGLANGSAMATLSGGTQPYVYNWVGNPSNTNIANNLSAGLTTLYVIDANNCIDTLSIYLTEPAPLFLNVEVIDESCSGKSDGEISANVSGGTVPYAYTWDNGANSNQNSGITAGAYSFTVTDANDCLLDSVILVGSLPPLTFETTAIPTTCSYTEDGAIKIDAINGVAPYSITLDNASATTTTFFENIEPGQHQIIITDGNGCLWEKDIDIVQPLPINALLSVSSDSILMGEVVELSVNSDNYLLTNILWQPMELVNCSTCLNITTQPFYNQRYKVTVKNDAGCEEILEQVIKVSRERPIFAPNVFSPNGDSNNNHFTIYGTVNATEIKYLRVFNRWGDILFERKNFPLNTPELGWDGTFRGKSLEAGVYIYSAEVEFVDKKLINYQGDVTILK